MTGLQRTIQALAGIYGVAGVALSAMAAHMDDARLFGTASLMLMVHAPALLALTALSHRLRLSGAAMVAMAAGVLLFAGDLLFRHRTGHGLFPMSAPTGGVLMMAGWVLVALGALIPPRLRDDGREG